jgi:hypothetical protein
MSNHDELHDPTLSRLYQQGAPCEPGREVDERIRAAAHEAVQRRWPAWWKLASTAAVLVLSIALVTDTLLIAPIEETTRPAPLQMEERAPSVPASVTDQENTTPPDFKAKTEQRMMRSAAPVKQQRAVGTTADSKALRKEMEGEASATHGPAFDSPMSLPKAESAFMETDEMASSCERFALPGDLDEPDWIELVTRIEASGDKEQAACLKVFFKKRFGKAFPEK